MIISLSPQRRDDTLTVFKQGDILTINGVAFDFGQIPEGATLPAGAVDSEYVINTIERIDGVLNLTLLLPTGPDATQAANFPQPFVNPIDGLLELPQ